VAKYRIVFDPNDQMRDVNDKLYRQYHIQKRNLFGWWVDLMHCSHVDGHWYQSRYRTKEACLERIANETKLPNVKPLQYDYIEGENDGERIQTLARKETASG
jgi:hypothetical protein